MIERVGHKKFSVYAFDVESHNDEITCALKDTSIWLYSFINENSLPTDPNNFGYNLHDFLNRLWKLSSVKRKNKNSPCRNILIYVWNLSFEFSFLLPVLYAHGFKWKDKIEKEDEYCFNAITTSSVSSVWLINMKFGKDDGAIMFKDLAKIFVGSLARVAKSFGLETQKGEIDYTLNRRGDYRVTDEEKNYNFKDTRIIIDILLKMDKEEDKDFWQSTSCASYSMRKMMKVAYPRCFKIIKKYRTENQYPDLEKDESEFLRKGVEGGICYASTDYQFKDIKQRVGHIDAHQMHPSSAYFNLMPFGKGEYFKGKYTASRARICAYHLKISYDAVKLYENIKLIGTPFVTDFNIWVWDFEIPTMMKCYVNLKIEYIEGYAYHTRLLPWRMFYKDNYEKRLIAKKNKDLFNVAQMKLLNNSSYGKLLENGHNVTFIPFIDGKDMIATKKEPRSDIKLGGKYTYLPVGSCIPAYSRVKLVETAFKIGWKNVIYFDTDSIFYLDNEETRLAVSKLNMNDELGGWGQEDFISEAQFACPKRYKLKLDNGTDDIKMAGINFKNEIPDFQTNIISGTYKVQRSERVKGGTIIIFQQKEVSVQDKYLATYETNAKIKR